MWETIAVIILGLLLLAVMFTIILIDAIPGGL